MDPSPDRSPATYLPLVLAATSAVTVLPLLLVLWLRDAGLVGSAWLGMVVGIGASVLAAWGGDAFWRTRVHSRDVLFSDLMLWGWLRRSWAERRLRAATGLLDGTSGAVLSTRHRAALLTRLTAGLEAQDPYTSGHSRRVARHATNIAKRMGLPRAEVARIRAAGAMHDVGKVSTPLAVLRKEGKLTPAEFATIRRHPVDGAVMVAALADPALTAMVRHHHERLDGTGYPDGLRGEEIPVGARVLAVADTFDAITSTRPYRHAHTHKEALAILVASAGTQLDAGAVRAFCACYSGRRGVAVWVALAHLRPRLSSAFGAGIGPAQAATVTSVAATAATTVAIGAGALSLGAPADAARPDERRPEAVATVASATAAPTPITSRARPWTPPKPVGLPPGFLAPPARRAAAAASSGTAGAGTRGTAARTGRRDAAAAGKRTRAGRTAVAAATPSGAAAGTTPDPDERGPVPTGLAPPGRADEAARTSVAGTATPAEQDRAAAKRKADRGAKREAKRAAKRAAEARRLATRREAAAAKELAAARREAARVAAKLEAERVRGEREAAAAVEALAKQAAKDGVRAAREAAKESRAGKLP